MESALYRYVYWTPRLLTILLVIFLGVFALEVFTVEGEWRELLVGFFIQLFPSLLVLLALLVAWRWEWLGALIFLILGLSYAAFFISAENVAFILTIMIWLFTIAVLFILAWIARQQILKQASPDDR